MGAIRNAPFAVRVDDQLARVRVVLKDTTHPGNIGATARAMKTMGLTRLYLAAVKTEIDGKARAMAAGAEDILQTAAFFPTLAAALSDCTVVFAFTARRRDLSPTFLTVRQAAAAAIERVRQGGEAAFVFGGERSGLENDDIRLAGFAVEIPTNPGYTSLNLAQAVQIAAYELRVATDAEVAPPKRDMPSRDEFEAMMRHLEEALQALGLPKERDTRPLMPRLRRLLTRAEPDESEVRLLRGVWRAILNK